MQEIDELENDTRKAIEEVSEARCARLCSRVRHAVSQPPLPSTPPPPHLTGRTQLTMVNDLMIKRLDSEPTSNTMMRHYTHRHQSILNDYRLEFDKTRVRRPRRRASYFTPPRFAPIPFLLSDTPLLSSPAVPLQTNIRRQRDRRELLSSVRNDIKSVSLGLCFRRSSLPRLFFEKLAPLLT